MKMSLATLILLFSVQSFADGMDQTGVPAGLLYENVEEPFMLWVELDAGKLHLIERVAPGEYQRRATRRISIGKNGAGKQKEGDLKTPIGVYQITSYLDDAELDDFYGAGAYPVNFPNVWDRIRNRSGYGIWLHGLPKGVDRRPRLDSEGCIIIDNESVEAMANFISVGKTLMVLSPSFEWLPTDAIQPSSDVLDAIDHWRATWEANEPEAYLANYHPEFTDTNRDLAEWSAYKRRVNRNKTFIDVDLSEMSVVEYPGESNLVAVRFYQEYRSSNFNWEGWKHLLWRRDDSGAWRIMYEGNG